MRHVHVLYKLKSFNLPHCSKVLEHYKQHWSCPGNIHHNHPRRKILFKHYIKRDRKSYMVYWRMHPKEYQAMRQHISKN